VLHPKPVLGGPYGTMDGRVYGWTLQVPARPRAGDGSDGLDGRDETGTVARNNNVLLNSFPFVDFQTIRTSALGKYCFHVVSSISKRHNNNSSDEMRGTASAAWVRRQSM
jgi:hypothetical protein